ncbi:hypothetical protein DPMN_005552 [Dreissena polymorpha]|uniref:Uncharacterized protein n=1 Tax=Dreissena polymorpha TaxID=45954 RepID=A0A9D4RU04_DREPO|nr:hypothetical protein DPMN_005552 [Dreissena polymorpha]
MVNRGAGISSSRESSLPRRPKETNSIQGWRRTGPCQAHDSGVVATRIQPSGD